MTRDQILAEIRRTAHPSGQALGRTRFSAETGITPYEWGRYWARWTDAVAEAGCVPSSYSTRLPDDQVLTSLALEVRRIGRLPTAAELRVRHGEDPTFPTPKVFERFGRRVELARQLAAFCEQRSEFADVLDHVTVSVEAVEPDEPRDLELLSGEAPGYVYLVKSGRFYKVGWTRDPGRRSYDLAIQLPEKVTPVHIIATDDPVGIERYWHGRFAERRANGEWFELTRADVAAFKKRKFM